MLRAAPPKPSGRTARTKTESCGEEDDLDQAGFGGVVTSNVCRKSSQPIGMSTRNRYVVHYIIYI